MRIVGLLAFAAAIASAQTMPIEGNPASKVRVIVYEDLQCPDCATFRRMMDEHLLAKYGKTVAFEHRDFPLAKHAWARKAAIASRFFASKNPELYVEWRRYVLSNIKQISAETFDQRASDWAKTKGLDPRALTAALNDKQLADAVEKDFQEGLTRGVGKTPTVFVDGEPFVETFTLEEITTALDKALK